jgi:hypothetical protein
VGLAELVESFIPSAVVSVPLTPALVVNTALPALTLTSTFALSNVSVNMVLWSTLMLPSAPKLTVAATPSGVCNCVPEKMVVPVVALMPLTRADWFSLINNWPKRTLLGAVLLEVEFVAAFALAGVTNT